RFITRSGVRVLLDQAAGIVIALLGALSVIALLTAGVMLAAAARADVQRRLRAIGVSRAIGSTRGHVALISALETLIVAVPVAARRVRLAATLAMLGISAAFVLLMLALASELSTLETDPASLGRRYQLTASLPPSAADRIRRIPGVAAAAPRYQLTAVDSFSLGETVDVIAYPGDHVTFESPPLVA